MERNVVIHKIAYFVENILFILFILTWLHQKLMNKIK